MLVIQVAPCGDERLSISKCLHEYQLGSVFGNSTHGTAFIKPTQVCDSAHVLYELTHEELSALVSVTKNCQQIVSISLCILRFTNGKYLYWLVCEAYVPVHFSPPSVPPYIPPSVPLLISRVPHCTLIFPIDTITSFHSLFSPSFSCPLSLVSPEPITFGRTLRLISSLAWRGFATIELFSNKYELEASNDRLSSVLVRSVQM